MVLSKSRSIFNQIKLVKGENLGIVSVSALLISLQFTGLLKVQIFDYFNISAVMVVTALIALAGLVFARNLSINKYLRMGLILAYLFLVWSWFEVFRSPLPVKGLTMFLLGAGNVAILWVVGGSTNLIKDFNRLNRLVFLLGVFIATLNLVLVSVKLGGLLLSTGDYEGILKPPVFRFFMGGEGLAGNPNFYSIWMGISLLCGVGLKVHTSRLWKWVGVLVIGISLLLNSSRSFMLAAFGATVVFAIVWALRNHKIRKTIGNYLKQLIILAILLLSFSLVPFPYSGQSVVQYMFERVYEGEMRWEYWSQSLGEVEENVWLGQGLRATEVTLGRYSHNSYIDLLVDTGVIGLVLWGIFAVFVSLRALRLIGSEAMLPWIHSWFITLIFMFFHSFLSNPFPWLLAAIVLGYTQND